MTQLLDRLAAFRPLPWIVGGGLFLLVAAWTFTVQPRYRSEALLRVQGDQAGGGLLDAVASMPGAPLLGLGRDELETEIGVLRSRRVIDAVIDSLALTARLVDAGRGVARSDFVDVTLGQGGEVEGILHFAPAGDGRFSLRAADLRPTVALPATVTVGEPITLGGTALRVRGAEAFSLELSPRYVARRALESRLDVRRQSAGAQLIALTYDDPEPAVAAAVLDRMLAEYLDFTARAARGELGSTASELRRQIDQQGARLTAAENELRRYQERTGLVMPEEQAAAQVKRYATLRGTLDALEVERNALARLLALVNERSGDGRDAQVYRQLATFPSLITNRAIQDLLLSLTTLENDRSELRLLRTDENADVRQLTDRIAEIERQLQRLGTQYLESLDEQIKPTQAAIAAIDAELAAVPERELQFIRLYRERTILNEGYLFLQKQLRQTELQDALRLDQVRVVDYPSVADPDDPEFPKPLVNLVLGLVLALTGGGAVGAAQSAVRLRESAHA